MISSHLTMVHVPVWHCQTYGHLVKKIERAGPKKWPVPHMRVGNTESLKLRQRLYGDWTTLTNMWSSSVLLNKSVDRNYALIKSARSVNSRQAVVKYSTTLYIIHCLEYRGSARVPSGLYSDGILEKSTWFKWGQTASWPDGSHWSNLGTWDSKSSEAFAVKVLR